MNRLRLVAFTFLALACAAAVARAQRPDRPNTPRGRDDDFMTTGSIRGRVLTPEGSPYQATSRITLQASNGGQLVIFTDYQGQFSFTGLIPGTYTLEVDADPARFQQVSQSVDVFRGAPSVVNPSLRYKPNAPHPSASDATVSVAELDKTIPEKARKEFKRGTEAAQAGKTEEAIAHLRKAVEIYPPFMMARNDLGVQLMLASRLEEATEQLREAVKLDPKAFNPQLNLGIALVRQQQFAEAAAVLEKAVSINPQSAAARFHLAQACAATGDSARAEKEFKAAYSLGGQDYAVALFYLGNLYLSRGERAKALESFNAYLAAAPNAAHAEEARRLVGVLR